ncbi:hypothetical protein [Granulicella paludicola]|uniref:hypothetical protein n=1 Tax=Granulicella paludicola TaxID=474951 RepID=UPI0021E0D321|nr:hypothetical protein [Granulicella paludicola]
MGWLIRCESAAARRYQRRAAISMLFYLLTLWRCVELSKHTHLTGWGLYALALLPAIPVLVTLGAMGRYLQEETDEYLRVQMVRSLLGGTAALLVVIVVSDFLQTLAHVGAYPPFTLFLVFMVVFGLTQCVQKLMNRVKDDE